MGKPDNWWLFPGFDIELVATGLDLPVNLAFVPKPATDPGTPLLYVTELYGQIKVVKNDWTSRTYAKGLLNFTPDHQIPGTGESGVIGICVEPETGDLFVSMIYTDKGEIKAKVVRTSSQNGLEMDSMKTIIDNIPSTTRAHQVQAVTIGFDGKLYVNVADGGESTKALDDDDLRGKILRMNLDGTIPEDNPKPGSYIYAKGFRNPFGAAWRKSDRSLYVSINGPDRDDVIAKVEAGKSYGWPMTMRQNSLFCWEFTQAPTAIAFMQDGQFPSEYNDELFVALFGNSYHKGRSIKGKKIVKMKLSADGSGVRSYDEFATYIGDGPATPCGMAFGPGGLYFSDLHGESDGPARAASGNIYRIKPKKKMARAIWDGITVTESAKYAEIESYVYFPPESVNWRYFRKTSNRYTCPRKGEAAYYDIFDEGRGRVIKNGAWSYFEPKEAARHIKDFIAFSWGEVKVRTERSG